MRSLRIEQYHLVVVGRSVLLPDHLRASVVLSAQACRIGTRTEIMSYPASMMTRKINS